MNRNNTYEEEIDGEEGCANSTESRRGRIEETEEVKNKRTEKKEECLEQLMLPCLPGVFQCQGRDHRIVRYTGACVWEGGKEAR